MDSLDVVEMVMVLEEAFGVEIPYDDSQHPGNPSEIVDGLKRRLSNQRPTRRQGFCSESSRKNNHGQSWLRASTGRAA
jgi:hypothetical protein